MQTISNVPTTPLTRPLSNHSPHAIRLRGYHCPPQRSPIPLLSFASPRPRVATSELHIPSSPGDMDDCPTTTALNRRIFICDWCLTASRRELIEPATTESKISQIRRPILA